MLAGVSYRPGTMTTQNLLPDSFQASTPGRTLSVSRMCSANRSSIDNKWQYHSSIWFIYRILGK